MSIHSGVRARDLLRASVDLGLHAARLGEFALAAELLWRPLDVDRVAELPWAGEAILRDAPRRVLDAASPKILAYYLSSVRGCDVTSVDLWEEEVRCWQRVTEQKVGDSLHYEQADLRSLPFADASFDAAFSVSVIEHIPSPGDAQAIAELERVVVPGGLIAITVPFRSQYEDEFVEHDLYGTPYEGIPIFFQHHYDFERVEDHLLAGHNLEVVQRGVWRKRAVRRVASAVQAAAPASKRLGLGLGLGPGLAVLGKALMVETSLDELGADNVLRLLLRRRR